MTELSPLDRFILSAAVGGMFTSLAFFAAQRTAAFWKAPFVRFARASRPVQALVLTGLVAVTALGGGKTNEPPARVVGPVVRTIPAENLPAWFVSLDYPATDADANGIPDCWEKWTHTRDMAADADPDGDGLTNLEEFETQTDPIRADTDGDGLDDGTELEGLAAGVADLDPLAPATFAADEPDADEDGVPDLWEDEDVAFFDGVDPDGFPWGFDVPEPAGTNYDVRLTVSSSRHAALTWGNGYGESLLLPPCTNLALRLRLCADDVKTVALSPSPNAATNPVGTWRAALVADWDPRRGFPTEGDRLALPAGTMVDRSERESVATQAWTPAPALRSGEPLRAGRGARKPSVSFTPRRMFLFVENDSFCSIHGPAPNVRVLAEHASPPYLWIERGVETETQTDAFTPSNPYPDGHYEFSVRWPDDHEAMFVQASIRLDPITCRSGQTNLVGAAWTSTHNPTNGADHAPGIETHEVSFGPLCPVAHDVDVKLGWTHDADLLRLRNLVLLPTSSNLDKTDHCIGKIWRLNGTIDFSSYLDSSCLPFLEKIEIRTVAFDGTAIGNEFRFSQKPPDERYPDIYHVDLVLKATGQVLDSFWLTVNSLVSLRRFELWASENESDLGWVSELPPPPSEVLFDGMGQISLPLFPARPSWNDPTACNSFLHHDARYEMRSCATPGGHGNQACFDVNGQIILSGIAAGTADRAHASIWNVNSHEEQDVIPFLWALQLDGNPGIPTFMNDIRHPCLYLGSSIRTYIRCRPIIHPDTSNP